MVKVVYEGGGEFDPTIETVVISSSSSSTKETSEDSERTHSAQSTSVASENVIQNMSYIDLFGGRDMTFDKNEVPSPRPTPAIVAPEQIVEQPVISASNYETFDGENYAAETLRQLHDDATILADSTAAGPDLAKFVVEDLEGKEDNESEKTESEGEVRKEQAESEGPLDILSRVATSTNGLNVFQSGIETVTVNPTVHEQILSSHSPFSQQSANSFQREIIHTLPATQSEFVGIETSRRSLQPIPIFQSQSSLDQHAQNNFHLTRTSTHLGDVGGTSVVAPSIGQSRGSDRSPTGANIMPTLNVGHVVASAGVLTGYLSDPGVITELKRYIDVKFSNLQSNFTQEIAAKSSHFETKLNEIAATLKSMKKEVVAKEDYNVEELKNLLHVKLNSLKNPNQEQRDLISALNTQQAQTSTLNTLKDDILTAVSKMTGSVTKTLSDFGKRIDFIETTCKTQAETLKRKRDDRDDPDRPNWW